MDRNPFGYVNGKPVFSRDEFIFEHRGFGPITDDDGLLAYAAKVTGSWSQAGWRRSFTAFHISDYALSEPRRSLTDDEFSRLIEVQLIAKKKEDDAENERGWRLIGTYGYADNSIEEVYEDRNGIRKTVMTVMPHGDVS